MFLSSRLASKNAAETYAALAALGMRGEKGAPAILNQLSSNDPYIRWAADRELERIFGKSCDFSYDAPEKEREEAVERWRDVVGTGTRQRDDSEN